MVIDAWFTSLGTERVKVTFEEVQTSGTSDLAIVSAIVTYAGHSAQGEQLRAMQIASPGPSRRVATSQNHPRTHVCTRWLWKTRKPSFCERSLVSISRPVLPNPALN